MIITDDAAEHGLLLAINRYIADSDGQPLSVELVEKLAPGSGREDTTEESPTAAPAPTPDTAPGALPAGVQRLPDYVAVAVWRDRDTHAAVIKYNQERRSRDGGTLCGKPAYGKSHWDVPLTTVTCAMCRRPLVRAGEVPDAS